MEKLKITLTGVSPLLLHNGRLANPLDKFSRELKAISGKRKKTEDDYEKMAKTEFLGSLYQNPQGEYTLPGHNIEAVMTDGAKINKLGKQIQGGAFIEEDPILSFDGDKKGPEELWDGHEHALVVSVKIKNARVMRTRPMIPTGWKVTFTVSYDKSVIQKDQIIQAFTDAGRQKGMGDWRPKYGRFVVS